MTLYTEQTNMRVILDMQNSMFNMRSLDEAIDGAMKKFSETNKEMEASFKRSFVEMKRLFEEMDATSKEIELKLKLEHEKRCKEYAESERLVLYTRPIEIHQPPTSHDFFQQIMSSAAQQTTWLQKDYSVQQMTSLQRDDAVQQTTSPQKDDAVSDQQESSDSGLNKGFLL